jgi:amidase
MSPSFDTVGWVAASAGARRLAGENMLEGGARPEQPARLKLASDLMAAADADVAQAVEGFLARAGLLPEVEAAELAGQAIADWAQCFREIQGFETWSSFGAWILRRSPSLGPGVAERMAYASTVTDSQVAAAHSRRGAIEAHLRDVLDAGTVMIFPTGPCPAPPLTASARALEVFRTRTLAFTCAAGLGGLPQISLPLAPVRGAPVAVSILGWHGGDEALLALASRLAVHCAY